MKLLRQLIPIVCILAACIARAGEQLAAQVKGTATQPIAADLQLLQGTWEGVEVSDALHQTITITITGNSFHFHRDTNFWFETTIALPAGTAPKQLHATIKKCPPSQAESIGKVVGAIYKVEGDTLTLVAYNLPDEPPKDFVSDTSRYVVKKLRPRKVMPKSQDER